MHNLVCSFVEDGARIKGRIFGSPRCQASPVIVMVAGCIALTTYAFAPSITNPGGGSDTVKPSNCCICELNWMIIEVPSFFAKWLAYKGE